MYNLFQLHQSKSASPQFWRILGVFKRKGRPPLEGIHEPVTNRNSAKLYNSCDSRRCVIVSQLSTQLHRCSTVRMHKIVTHCEKFFGVACSSDVECSTGFSPVSDAQFFMVSSCLLDCCSDGFWR